MRCPAGDIDRMFADFVAHYSAHIADRSRPFPGLSAALDRLAARNCRLAVCTNKLEALSRLLLDALGLTRRFAAICGQDTFGIQKPDPEILRRTIAAAGGELRRAVMVGDSGTDIATARAAGIPGGGGRFRLQRDADGDARARPADRPFRRLAAAIEARAALPGRP